MSEAWVINASPIITLSKVGQIELLFAIDRQILVPDAVVREVAARDDPGAQAVRSELAACVQSVALLPSVLEWGLGEGETAVLSMAKHVGAWAVIDDQEARTAARSLGISFLGTLGVVLRARREGRIEAAEPVVRALLDAGLHLDLALVEEALTRFCGETWKG